jgi:hypothetical protein
MIHKSARLDTIRKTEGAKRERQMGEGNMWPSGRKETGRMTVDGKREVAIGDRRVLL